MEADTEKTLTEDLWIEGLYAVATCFYRRAYELGNNQRIDLLFRALGFDLRAAQA